MKELALKIFNKIKESQDSPIAIGILIFNNEPTWWLPLQSYGECWREVLQEFVDDLKPDGVLLIVQCWQADIKDIPEEILKRLKMGEVSTKDLPKSSECLYGILESLNKKATVFVAKKKDNKFMETEVTEEEEIKGDLGNFFINYN